MIECSGPRARRSTVPLGPRQAPLSYGESLVRRWAPAAPGRAGAVQADRHLDRVVSRCEENAARFASAETHRGWRAWCPRRPRLRLSNRKLPASALSWRPVRVRLGRPAARVSALEVRAG